MERSSRRALVSLCMLSCAGCASHGPVHVAPDDARPHVSWEIRAGTGEAVREFMCGSARPGRPCVLAPSTEKTRRFATIRLFVHAAAQPTSHLGFMRVSFLGGEADQKLGEINATVQPGSPPVGTTVIGRVTSKPGEYVLTISVNATQPGMRDPVCVCQDVPVVVK